MRPFSCCWGPGQHVRLTAGQGPQARYTAWLKVLRGHVRCVVGTRAAMFAPVHDLGLVAWWDDGDDVLVEQRAPYPQVREVLRARARLEGAALLTGGFTRTTSVQQWVESGQVRSVCADPATRRLAAPACGRRGRGHGRRTRWRGCPCAPALGRMASSQERAGARAGADPGPAPGLPPVVVLPDLPRAGALCALPWAVGVERRRCGADVSVVWDGRRSLRVQQLWWSQRAVHRGGCPPNGRGARPRVPGRAGPHLRCR